MIMSDLFYTTSGKNNCMIYSDMGRMGPDIGGYLPIFKHWCLAEKG